MDKQRGYAARSCSIKMQHGHAARTCSIPQLVATAWTCNMEIWTWTIDMNK
jgi:hypothetical protein